jgi:N-hydroxyarylamine O-acetyltransferase
MVPQRTDREASEGGTVDVPVERYLARIGYTATPRPDVDTLRDLQLAHLRSVPFENLDVYRGVDVSVDPADVFTKILDHNRGGWCFELNGAFALLLEAIGFDVTRLGAAVLLGGPTVVIDHLCLEVTLDEPYLVDVGFGDGFVLPIPLNRPGPHDGGVGRFELLPSPQGTTLTRELDGVPAPQYRFKRVARALADFGPTSRRLQDDKNLIWHTRGFATRLVAENRPDRRGRYERVTLVGNQLKRQYRTDPTGRRSDSESTDVDVSDDEWSAVLTDHFGMSVDLEGPAQRR